MRFFPVAFLAAVVHADVGDPQVRTDDPWYPGELAFSTFERLFATEAEVYERVTGVKPTTDEQKALASWLWRNTHYFHCQEAGENVWGKGFEPTDDLKLREWTREYWTGLFGRGFGLCYTTHAEWAGEMEFLLGHGRARANEHGVHTSFEVFLKGGAYGEGRWALLDHDIASVLFLADGSRLASLKEVRADPQLEDRRYLPERQHGWLPHSLAEEDAGAYAEHPYAELLPGYAGPPPMVHLRRGETLRRYPDPGLDDGKTFVYWGWNANSKRIPGPARDRTWVNQPDSMYESRKGTAPKAGMARFGNAVYTYRPDFASGDYREGVVDEGEGFVVFEFLTPYLIGATPGSEGPWRIIDPGCRNGLVLHGKAACPVSISVDLGKTWRECGAFADGMDLTDHVKGRRQYLLRLDAGAKALAGSGLSMVTICQANVAVVPRLKEDGSEVTFFSSGQAVVSAGACLDQAQARVVDGAFGTPTVTMELAAPRSAPATAVYAAACVESGDPPDAEAKYAIDCSTDGGKTWTPVVKDWTVPRMGEDPPGYWPQSMCFGSVGIEGAPGAVRVRFSNSAGRKILRAEAHLVYRTGTADATKVTFDWTDRKGAHRESHVFGPGVPSTWKLDTGKGVTTWWVEYEPVPAK